jgi:hypothetical protein
MPRKRFLVLANSHKKQPGRCIAGVEVSVKNAPKLGQWVRPISQDQAEGELLPQHRRVKDSAQVRPLDIVSVPVKENAGNAAHPEDWFVTTDEPWEIVATLDKSTLPDLVEAPKDLWLQAKKSTDRVTAEFIAASTEHQSIFLIKPTNLRLRLWREYNSWKGYIQKKLRVLFDYNGTTYDLSLTDPIASQKYVKTFPAEDEPAIEIKLPEGDNYVLCVSLTPALNGIHYKVVATILDLP